MLDSLETTSLVWEWVKHSILAIVIPVLSLEIAFAALGWSEFGSPFGPIGIQVVKFCLLGASSFFLGIWVGRSTSTRRDRVVISVWIVPFGLLVFSICYDLFIFHFKWWLIWIQYFYWSTPGRNGAPFAIDLITYPALSSVAYVVGMKILRSERSGTVMP